MKKKPKKKMVHKREWTDRATKKRLTKRNKNPLPEPAVSPPELLGGEIYAKFPPPRDNPIFVQRWAQSIESVTKRENFKRTHLATLEILCDLYVDYARLTEFIQQNGYTFTAVGRHGTVIHPYPEVKMRAQTITQIKNYTALLDLKLKKDQDTTNNEESEEWG